MFITSMESTTPKKFMRIADILTSKGYHVGNPVGHGTYANVRSVERRSDGKMCAVKIIDRMKVRKDYLTKFMPRELEIVLKLEHPNVIRTYDVIETRDFVFQIMQYAENGDVLKMIHRYLAIPEKKCKNIFRDIAKGMKYMHGKNIAHRDLKCENILLLKCNVAAICDFGFAREYELTTSDILCRTFCGSSAYASPELLQGLPYNPKLDDIWGMGCILFTMLCGTMPFDDGNVTVQVEKQKKKEFTFPSRVIDRISETGKMFVSQILEPCPSKRMTIDEMLSSDWLKV